MHVLPERSLRSGLLCSITAMVLFGGPPKLRAQEAPTVDVEGPTVIAFFHHVTDAELEKDPDINEAPSDFQLYADQAREPMERAGIDFQAISARSFTVRPGDLGVQLCLDKAHEVPTAEASAPEGGSTVSFAIQTSAFSAGGTIPKRFTCDGSDVSPELTWSGVPAGTQAFALIVDDPDAPGGTWTHWIAWDIPANATKLAEGTSKNETLADGTRQGRNDFRRIGYNGPCPPPGKPHRYFFKLYAMGAKLDVKAGASRSDLESAMKGKTLGQAEVMGNYGR